MSNMSNSNDFITNENENETDKLESAMHDIETYQPSKLVIDKHNFDKYKSELQKLMSKDQSYFSLRKVDISGGPFGWGDHKVTGYELNDITGDIQTEFLSIQTKITDIYKHIQDEYRLIEALDEDYIGGILTAFSEGSAAYQKAQKAQKEINQIVLALQAFRDKLKEMSHLNDIDIAWDNINELHDQVEAILNDPEIVKRSDKIFKTVSSLKHISQVDAVWDDVGVIKNWKNNLQQNILPSTEKRLKKAEDNFEQLNNKIGNEKEIVRRNEAQYSELLSLKDQLSKSQHIHDVDDLWEQSMKVQNDILPELDTRLNEATALIGAHKIPIDALTDFKNRLENQEHLHDIDTIWSRCDASFELVSGVESKTNSNSENIVAINNKVDSLEESLDDTGKSLKKKLKIAYYLIGGTFSIAAIELIMLITRLF